MRENTIPKQCGEVIVTRNVKLRVKLDDTWAFLFVRDADADAIVVDTRLSLPTDPELAKRFCELYLRMVNESVAIVREVEHGKVPAP